MSEGKISNFFKFMVVEGSLVWTDEGVYPVEELTENNRVLNGNDSLPKEILHLSKRKYIVSRINTTIGETYLVPDQLLYCEDNDSSNKVKAFDLLESYRLGAPLYALPGNISIDNELADWVAPFIRTNHPHWLALNSNTRVDIVRHVIDKYRSVYDNYLWEWSRYYDGYLLLTQDHDFVVHLAMALRTLGLDAQAITLKNASNRPNVISALDVNTSKFAKIKENNAIEKNSVDFITQSNVKVVLPVRKYHPETKEVYEIVTDAPSLVVNGLLFFPIKYSMLTKSDIPQEFSTGYKAVDLKETNDAFQYLNEHSSDNLNMKKSNLPPLMMNPPTLVEVLNDLISGDSKINDEINILKQQNSNLIEQVQQLTEKLRRTKTMNTNNEKRFRMGQIVVWDSQAGGHATTKVGRVVGRVPANTNPIDEYRRVVKKFNPADDKIALTAARDHVSYLVLVDQGEGRRPRLYWPLVKNLEKFDDVHVFANSATVNVFAGV
jgi:hypothetical protein